MSKKEKRARAMSYYSRASRILRDIFQTGELIVENMHQPGLAFRYGLEEAIEIRDARERAIQKKELKRLKERHLIRIEKIADKHRVELTDEGKLEVLKQKIQSAEPLPEGWDCIVLFDIPESHRRLRDGLRRLLVEMGFFCIQRSVWMSPFDVAEALSRFFKVAADEQWVRVYVGKRF